MLTSCSFINHSGDFVGFKQQTLGTKPTRMVRITRWSYNNDLVHKLGEDFFVFDPVNQGVRS